MVDPRLAEIKAAFAAGDDARACYLIGLMAGDLARVGADPLSERVREIAAQIGRWASAVGTTDRIADPRLRAYRRQIAKVLREWADVLRSVAAPG